MHRMRVIREFQQQVHGIDAELEFVALRCFDIDDRVVGDGLPIAPGDGPFAPLLPSVHEPAQGMHSSGVTSNSSVTGLPRIVGGTARHIVGRIPLTYVLARDDLAE